MSTQTAIPAGPPPKERILRAAQELFGEYGYAGTTFKRIAERGDITLGLITHHFGSKERLYVACSLEVMETILERLRGRITQSESGFRGVLAFVETYFDCSTDEDLNFRILVSSSPYSDAGVGVERTLITAKFTELIGVLQGCIERGMEDGSIRDCDAARTAGIIFAFLVGAVRTHLLTPFSWEEFYDDVATFVTERLAA
jgi:AcrR family transcriptional regulator